MKKTLIILATIFALAAIAALGARVFTGEDSWLCTETGWVRHGNPKAPMPSETCGAQKVTIYFYKYNPDSTSCALMFPVEREIALDEDKLTGALNALFAGPTEAEKEAGYSSFFSPATKDLLHVFKIEDGKAFVDLKDFRRIIPNANSSCGGEEFLAEMDTTIKSAAPEVNMTVYSIEGEPTTFYEWMQLGCFEANNWCNSPFSKMSVTPKAADATLTK